MDQTQIIILDFLLDDHFALWDFADSFPQYRPEARPTAVEDLIELVRHSYVTVTFGRWHENETATLPLVDAEAALRDPCSWLPTGRQPGYVLELTPEGKQFLHERGIGIA